MEESLLDRLRRLTASAGPSGFESEVQAVVRHEVQPFSDELRTDGHGNVIAALNPTGRPRVMLTAHCDELGFLIRYIDEQGYLYFAPIGGFDPATLPGSRVMLHAPGGPLLGVIGCQAIHLIEDEDRGKAPKLAEMWIDIGAASQEEAQRLVPLGTHGTRAARLETLRGDLVVSRALDNRSGLCAIIEALRRIHAQREQLKAGVYLVSAVQEEVGSRGSRTSAYTVQPDIALTVDATFASDHPQTSKERLGEVKLGGGPGITLGGFVNGNVAQGLMAVAKQAGIAFQYDIQASHTGTDNDTIQITRGGVATGLLNIPSRYMHSGSEVVSLADIDSTAELMARFVLSLSEDVSLVSV